MRFLCKNCGAQSPGDLSEVAVRDGALVFTCRACGASATLVENHEPGAAAKPAAPPEGARIGKGIVEPDEAELVELGQATISRMLGRKVRIVDDTAPQSAPEPLPAAPRPAGAEPAEPELPVPVLAVAEARASRGRFVAGVVAGLVLAAVVTFALLEARQPAQIEGVRGPDAAIAKSVELVPGVAPAATPSVPADSRLGPSAPTVPERPVARPAAATAAPTRSPRREPPAAASIAEPRVEAPSPAAPHPAAGPASDHVDEAFQRIRPGVRMCALQERRRNADAKLGEETVTVTFAPSGEAQRVAFASAGLEGTPLGECLALELRKARVEPFPGEPWAVRRVLSLAPGGGAN